MRLRLALIALALVACSSGTPTTPGNTGPAAPIADISGVWTMAFTSMVGGGLTCSTTGIVTTITDQDGSFTGTSTSSWYLTCTATGSQPTVVAQTGASITNGSVRGSDVVFSLATNNSSQSGTYNSSTSISGTASWQIEVGGYPVTLSGQFSLVR